MGTLLLECIPQSLPEPIDLSQALLDRLLSSGGMFDVVLDRRLQVVDRCRDRLRLFSEAQGTEFSRVPFMSPRH
jgi:hypothetical protein